MTLEEQALLKHLASNPADDNARLELADHYADRGMSAEEFDQRAVIAVRPVLEHPDEDEPRLEFADFCDLHGRTARAESIRMALRINGLPNCPSWCDHSRDRCKRVSLCHDLREKLILCREDIWAHPGWYVIPPDGDWEDNRKGVVAVFRGFVDSMFCVADKWLEVADYALLRHPVKRVNLTTLPEVESRTGEDRLEGKLPDGSLRPWRSRQQVMGNLVSWDVPYDALALRLLQKEFPGVTFALARR